MCEYMCVKSLTKNRSAIKFNLHILQYFENKTKKIYRSIIALHAIGKSTLPPPPFSADLWLRTSNESVILVS